MSGNARFHDKLHRANHHTLSTGGLLDSAYDPIASPEHPFRGDFILSGSLSALGDIIANNLNIKSEITIDGNTTTQNQTIVGSLKLSKQYYGATAIYAINPTTRPDPFTLSINYENGVFISNDLYVNGIIYGNLPTVNGYTPSTTDISNAYVILKSNSANWDSVATGADLGVRTLTSNWQNTYNTVSANSAIWGTGTGGADTALRSLTGNWQNTYTTVNTNSSNWNYQGTDIKALTGKYESTYTTVNSNSSKYESTYTTVNTNSSNWNYQGTDIKALTGKYESTYTTVNTNSSNWLSRASIVSAASAKFDNLSADYIRLRSYAETSVSALPASLSPTIYQLDLSQGTVFNITLVNNIPIGGGFLIQNIPPGVNSFILTVTQNNIGGWTVDWNFFGFTLKWSGGAPTVTSTANATDIYSFMSIDGNTWYGSVAGKNFV